MPGHLDYLLTAYLFNNLSAEGLKQVESHLNECLRCRTELEELRSTLWLVESAVGSAEGAAEYSFEEPRLQRILQAGRALGIGSWLRAHRYAVGVAAVFLMLVIGFFSLTSSFYLRESRSRYSADRAWVDEPAQRKPERLFGDSYGADMKDADEDDIGLDLEEELPTREGGTTVALPRAVHANRRAGADESAGVPARPPALASEPAEETLLPLQEEIQAEITGKKVKKLIARLKPDAITPDIPKGTTLNSLSNKNLRYKHISALQGPTGRAGGSAAPSSGARDAGGETASAKVDDSALVDFEDIAADPTEDDDAVITFYDNAYEPQVQSFVQPGRGAVPAEEVKKIKEALEQAWGRREARKYSSEIRSMDRAGSSLAEELTGPADFSISSLTFEQNGNLTVRVPATNGEPSGLKGKKSYPVPLGKGFVPKSIIENEDTGRIRTLNGVTAGYRTAVTEAETGAVRLLPVPRQMSLRSLREVEDLLRDFVYFRALDPNLSFDAFKVRRLPVPAPSVGDEGLGRDGFRDRYGSNPFVDTRRDHYSTFGMDVDTASYTYARNVIRSGELPKPAAVRVEEFVNYFPEEYPTDPETVFSVFCEGGPSPFGEGLELLKIAVRARELRPGERRNAALTFAIDTSGSMASSVGNQGTSRRKRIHASGTSRLQLVRDALRTLVAALGPDDRVGIVAYSTHPYLVLPHTSARHRTRILGAIDSLQPGGATNVEAGLDLTYRVADEIFDPKALNRVILCSDGVANVGARGPEKILKKVEFFARRGIYLSCVGFGMGRYNDVMLETLANKGNGNYAYVDALKEARKIFEQNLPATLQVLARDAKIQVDFNPEAVSHYRLLGYENRDIRDKDFRNDKVDAGEVGPGTTVTVLYEIQRRTIPHGDIGRIYLRYRDTGTQRVDEVNYPLSPGVLATRLSETSDRFRFAAAVAETAELLRNSYWARDGSYGDVLGLLATLGPEFRATPAWKELTELLLRVQALTVQRLTKLAASTGKKSG